LFGFLDLLKLFYGVSPVPSPIFSLRSLPEGYSPAILPVEVSFFLLPDFLIAFFFSWQALRIYVVEPSLSF